MGSNMSAQMYEPFAVKIDASSIRSEGRPDLADELEQSLPIACWMGLLSIDEAMEFNAITADVLEGKLIALTAQMWLALSGEQQN
jgi:hypothetical protein